MSITLAWPVYTTAPVTQRYGENPGSGYKCMADGSHNGVDFGIPQGTPIYAAADGTITRCDLDSTGYGLHVRIQHDGYLTLYGHLSTVNVKKGQAVRAGEVIGESGNTGNSTGPHLHFEVRTVADNCKSTVDPLYYLQNSTAVKFHGTVTDAGNGLRVRAAPSFTGEVKRYLATGDRVAMTEIRGNWGRLFEAGERWVCLHSNGVIFVNIDGAAQPELTDAEKLARLWAAHPELH